VSEQPLALISNDDGFDSVFLRELASATSELFEVVVCAPSEEQSWIGHAISRNRRLVPEAVEGFSGSAYKLNGTPADCVNFALGHLMPREPDVVISGINLGYNVTLPMVLSSGTVGAALEGALHGIRSVATSMALPVEEFDEIRESKGQVSGELMDSLQESAKRSAMHALALCEKPAESELVVHNLNFPENTSSQTELVEAFPDNLRLGSLFQPMEDGNGYGLVYQTEWLDVTTPTEGSDLAALRNSQASAARLNFSGIRTQHLT